MSLLSQTYRNLEIILIDDGSNDKSPEIIKTYYKSYPDIIKVIQQKNNGVASARNKGLKEASGDYIMFVDSDDYLHNACIENILAGARQKDADITRFKMIYKYVDGTEKTEKSDFQNETLIEKEYFNIYIYNKIITGIKMNSICKTLYKRSIIDGVLFREDMPTAEDLLFNIKTFSKADSFLYLPYPYYYYYQSNQGLTGKSISVFTKYKCNLIVSIVILKHLKQWEMLSIGNILKTVLRLLFITFSKLKRRFLKSV
jgi:glycosyltransferase involved in cell wall biosynthesis